MTANQCLRSLPQPLLHHLGATSRLDTLAALPQVAIPLATLRQHTQGESYHVGHDAHGLTLTLQCINPTAAPEEHQWGLHGITLDAASWNGGWPVGLNPQTATAHDVLALFAPNPDEVVNLHPMLCFAIEGVDGQACSVMALFDPTGHTLNTLGFIRVGPWRALPA